MKPIQLFDAASSTYTYLLFDENSTERLRPAIIIDPVDEQLERDLAALRHYGLQLVWAVETHAHADHITSAGLLAEHAGAKTAAPSGCGIHTAAMQLQHGDALAFGGESLMALHTPGHTSGSMCFLWNTREGQHVFTGDTLLIGGCGRTDFQSGSAEALYNSITKVLFALPDDTIVWPGHDYQGNTDSTIGAEKSQNPRIAGKSLEAFTQLMGQLNLPKPKRIDEAVPANQSSGIRHDMVLEADDDMDPSLPMHARHAEGYAGDIAPRLANQWGQSGAGVLVDVRTDAEREWVGFVPGAVAIAWKQWPGMALNPAFDEQLLSRVAKDKKVMFLCRSGVRSIPAAKRASELGFEAYNILEGFEGDPDENAHRGVCGGWRFMGLPWRQS